MSALAVREAAPGLVSLSELMASRPKGHELAAGVWARLEGETVRVTAVLERRAVVEDAGGERRLADPARLLVDPADVGWQAPPLLPPDRRQRRYRGFDRQVACARSDRRAIEDQERHAQRPAAPAPGPATDARHVEPDRAGDIALSAGVEASPAGAPARSCGRCQRALPAHSRRGLCVPCQQVCPGCDGPKSVQAALCAACERGPVQSMAEHALEELPAQVQQLLEMVARLGQEVTTLARYARTLEDELEHHRSAQRELHRLGRRIDATLAERRR